MRWKIGDVTVTKVVELEMGGGHHETMPQATEAAIRAIAWLRPGFADAAGGMKLSVHALAIEAPGRRIVVDTCIGNDKQGRSNPAWNGRQGPFLADLEAAGFPPEAIDTVINTHLHADHVGWNTRLVQGRWVPTFPRAQYLIGRVEHEYWQAAQDPPVAALVLADSVAPVMEAGLAALVEAGAEVAPGIALIATPGHTPGHLSVAIESRGERGLITGDFTHHPSQLAHPDWSTLADTDPEQGIETRARMFGHLAGAPVLVIGSHYAGATAGRIVRDGDAFRLEA